MEPLRRVPGGYDWIFFKDSDRSMIAQTRDGALTYRFTDGMWVPESSPIEPPMGPQARALARQNFDSESK